MDKKAQKGYTMIEVVAVLSILIMVMSGMAKTVTSMFSKYKNNDILMQIRDLRKVISDRYAAIGDYTGLTPKLLIDEKIAPRNMIIGNNLYNSFTGLVTVGAGKAVGNNKSFIMTFNNIPDQSCREAATINWRVDDTSTLISLKINEKTYSWPINKIVAGAQGANDLPLTMPMATAACNKGEKNILVWEFQ